METFGNYSEVCSRSVLEGELGEKRLEEVGEQPSEQTVSDLAREPLKVAVAVPSLRGSWPFQFGECLANMVQHFQGSEYEGEHEIRVFSHGGRVMPEVRHRLIGTSLGWGATHILMVTPEFTFPPDSIHRMLARGRAVIGINYLRDIGSCEYSAYRGGETVKPDPVSPEIEEVDGVAIGMILFNTPIFDVLDLPFFINKQIGESPGFEEDFIPFWEQCKEKEIPCVIDHALSKEVKSYGELWH